MSVENTAGLGVNASYGPREREVGKLSGGLVSKHGSVFEAVVYIRGNDFDGGTSFDTELTIPAGGVFLDATCEVNEVFALGGTTPTINVGTNGSEGTNYVLELSEASAESLSTSINRTGAGDFANPLTADAAIGVALDGTSPTVTADGAAKVVIRYIKI